MASNKTAIIFVAIVIAFAGGAWILNSNYGDIHLKKSHLIFGIPVFLGLAYLVYLLRKK